MHRQVLSAREATKMSRCAAPCEARHSSTSDTGASASAVRVGRSFRVLETDVDEYLRKSFYSAG